MTTATRLAALAEDLADLLMDLRMDGPAVEGRTYQQTMRHHAAIIVERLLPSRLADDPFAIWQGACGHLWRRLPDPNECPTCAEIARLRDELRGLVCEHTVPKDWTLVHNARLADLRAIEEAARAVELASEAARDAINGLGHPGEDHDRMLWRSSGGEIEVYETVSDCAACGGAQYGTDDQVNTAHGVLRHALGLEVRPWEQSVTLDAALGEKP